MSIQVKRWSVQSRTPTQTTALKKSLSDFETTSARLNNYRSQIADVCNEYSLPMMSGLTMLPNIAKFGLATRDVMEMPEDQEETPCNGRHLDNFEQAALIESPLPTRNKKA